MKKTLYILIVGALFIFLALNIASSQTISPLYFELVKGNSVAAVSFLQKIESLADFSYYKNLFSNDVQKAFSKEESKQDLEIAQLEALLEKNPQARDILYNLYLLYNHAGDNIKAQEYLKRAQEVDPTIK